VLRAADGISVLEPAAGLIIARDTGLVHDDYAPLHRPQRRDGGARLEGRDLRAER
jgi:hypothetical protein